MADGLSLVANVVAVGGLVVKSSQGLIELISAIRSAPREVRYIQNDLDALRRVLEDWSSDINEPDVKFAISQDPRLLNQVEGLRQPLENCNETLTLLKWQLAGYLKSRNGTMTGLKRASRGAIWFFKNKKEVERLLSRLATEKQTLTMGIIPFISRLNADQRMNNCQVIDESPERVSVSQRGQWGSECTDYGYIMRKWYGESRSEGPSSIKSDDRFVDEEFVESPSHQELDTTSRASLQSSSQQISGLKSKMGIQDPLWQACSLGNYNKAATLLKQGHDPNVRGSTPFTCLHIASFKEFYDIVKLLLEHGADVHATVNAHGYLYGACVASYTSLQIACAFGLQMAIRKLLTGRADVNMKSSGTSPLHCAFDSRSISVLRDLLEEGADPDTLNDRGLSVLHLASIYTEVEIAQVLLSMGARADIPSGYLCDVQGQTGVGYLTPLHLAAISLPDDKDDERKLALIRLLHQSQPERILDARDSRKFTPLHLAAENESTLTLDCLLMLGSNPNAVEDIDGETPLHRAARNNNLTAVSSLLRYSANPNIPSFHKRSAKEVARRKGYMEVVYLIENYESTSHSAADLPSRNDSSGSNVSDEFMKDVDGK